MDIISVEFHSMNKSQEYYDDYGSLELSAADTMYTEIMLKILVIGDYGVGKYLPKGISMANPFIKGALSKVRFLISICKKPQCCFGSPAAIFLRLVHLFYIGPITRT